MTTIDHQDALDFALSLAALARRVTRANWLNREPGRKADDTIVTEADLCVQRALIERINVRFPDHAILAEEDTDAPANLPDVASARHVWVLDPIDGTRNFQREMPCFCTSIALLDEGRPVVGVIVEHNAGLVFTAVAGRGTTRDSRPVRVNADVPAKPIVTFQPATDGSTYDLASHWLADVHPRNFGTTALHLALLASGAVDAALCIENRIWDVAAGALMVTEAGGVITDLAGKPMILFDLSSDPRRMMPFIAAAPGALQRLPQFEAAGPFRTAQGGGGPTRDDRS